MREIIRPCVSISIGTEDSIFLWKDLWQTLGVLEEFFPLGLRQLSPNAQFRLVEVIDNGEWSWPRPHSIMTRLICEQLPCIRAGGEDNITWNRTAHGVFISESAREFLRDKEEKKSSYAVLRFPVLKQQVNFTWPKNSWRTGITEFPPNGEIVSFNDAL
ncbi:hypothetical protein BUALT_Bualt10G0033600 [Buddleja alternifolia]|uniref:Uncharacterized protein n=1 Tax=Buddleja alternifolia TaxID=168488 RepID=A0AAV6WWU2_9LAMI|nr:hypothetical protein BUALT_Bualt10G0033600 [Buddleja alternifolia]